jgi:hypothetical protein
MVEQAEAPGALEPWQAEISFPTKTMNLEEAVEKIRPALKVQSGNFEIVDGPYSFQEYGRTIYLILLELDSSLMEGQTTFSAEKDGVRFEIETP